MNYHQTEDEEYLTLTEVCDHQISDVDKDGFVTMEYYGKNTNTKSFDRLVKTSHGLNTIIPAVVLDITQYSKKQAIISRLIMSI